MSSIFPDKASIEARMRQAYSPAPGVGGEQACGDRMQRYGTWGLLGGFAFGTSSVMWATDTDYERTRLQARVATGFEDKAAARSIARWRPGAIVRTVTASSVGWGAMAAAYAAGHCIFAGESETGQYGPVGGALGAAAVQAARSPKWFNSIATFAVLSVGGMILQNTREYTSLVAADGNFRAKKVFEAERSKQVASHLAEKRQRFSSAGGAANDEAVRRRYNS